MVVAPIDWIVIDMSGLKIENKERSFGVSGLPLPVFSAKSERDNMELCDQWRTAWCIGSIFSAPQLITGPSAEILGPLLFERVGDPLPLLSTGYISDFLVKDSLNPNDEVDRFWSQNKECFVPNDVLHECAAEDMHMQHLVSIHSNLVFGNRLEGLKCRDGIVQLFFPAGTNMSEIGSICYDKEMEPLKLCKQLHCNLETNVLGRQFFPVSSNIRHQILQLATVGRGTFIFDDSVEGFLLARTAYAVHWFRAETRGSRTIKHIAFANFRTSVSHACWNPHLPEESAVILENGELRLFDISSCHETHDCPVKLKGKSLPLEVTKVSDRNNIFPKKRIARKKYWQGLSEGDIKIREDPKESWWRCEYGWHPRVLLVASCNEVRLVDFRTKKEKVPDYSTIIAKANWPEASSYCIRAPRKNRFVALARADYDIFKFAVATQQHVLLFDLRQPLTPILQWEHGLKQSPVYLQMLKLSELRLSVGKKYKWASDSGHAILAANFKSGDMRVFCYGPKPSSELSVCKTRLHMPPVSCNTDMPEVLYSWELPSKLFTASCLSSEDNATDLSIQGDSPSAVFLYPKIEKFYLDAQPDSICGFYIVSDCASHTAFTIASEESEQNTTLGFSLLQLTGTGELLSQRYQASRRLIRKKSRSKGSSGVKISAYENLSFQKNTGYMYNYRRLPCFFHYLMTGSTLDRVLPSNFARHLKVHKQSETHLVKSPGCTLLCADGSGSLPPLKDVLHQLTCPCSIYEISCKRLWMSLPLDLLKLAFAAYSDIVSLERRLPPDFQQIFSCDCVQMPLFYLSNIQKENKHKNSEKNEDQFIMGPMLPLPFLLDQQQRKETTISGSTGNALMSGQETIQDQCRCISDELNNVRRVGRIPQVGGSSTVSLEDDIDVWPSQQDLQEENYLLLHEPSKTPFEGKKILSDCGFRNASEEIKLKETLDSNVHAKYIGSRCCNFPSGNDGKRPVMFELDRDICPINLSFEAESDLKAEEVEGLNRLSQKYHNWQKGFKLYQNYLEANVYRSP